MAVMRHQVPAAGNDMQGRWPHALFVCKQMLANVLPLMYVPCLVIFLASQFITDAIAAHGLPVLMPVEEYRDFISYASDPLRSNPETNETGGFAKLFSIDAIAARGNDLFVADSAQRSLFLIDRAQHSISKFVPLQGAGGTDLSIASDFSVYVIDRSQRQVLQYSRAGHLLGTFAHNIELSSPVAVAESAELDRVLVADAVTGHIVVFNKLGGLSRILGQSINAPWPISSIIDMVSDRGYIYLLDRLAREVSVIDIDGRHLISMGGLQLKQPVAMAIDHCQRLFVADQFNNSLHVFYDNAPLIVFENSTGLNGVVMITDIWIDNALLYVADGVTGSIKVLRITGSC